MFSQFTFYITIYNSASMQNIYLESIVYFITFLAPAHFSHGPDECGPGDEYRHVWLPLSPVICAPCGHCCEEHIKAQAPCRACAAVPCSARREWDECL